MSTFEQRLQTLMAAAGLPSYRTLSLAAGVSRASLNHLRQGQVDRLRVGALQRLSQALEVSMADLLCQFGENTAIAPDPPTSAPTAKEDTLRQEYERLQRQMETQAETLRQQLQREVITQLESWLVQWPRLVAATQRNPDLPASKAIPLVRPVTQLLESWGVTPIGSMGAEVAYDPTLHRVTDSAIAPGQPVQVTQVGYRQGDQLLYRAEVKPIS